MSQIDVELIVAAFRDEYGAENALKNLEEAKKEHGLGIYASAVIRRDADNVLHIRETTDKGTGKGAAVGALIGGVIGLLFPAGVLATSLLGATVGGMAARLTDKGFSDDRLGELGTSLKPGTSALIALVNHEAAPALESQLIGREARVVRQVVNPDIAAELGLESELMPTNPDGDRGGRTAQSGAPAALSASRETMITGGTTASTELVNPKPVSHSDQDTSKKITGVQPNVIRSQEDQRDASDEIDLAA